MIELNHPPILDLITGTKTSHHGLPWGVGYLLQGPLKISNSGDTLKFLIPSYSWKAIPQQGNPFNRIRGPSNDRCMVIIQNLLEKVMGNRGSKLVIPSNVGIAIKEQRVDGIGLNQKSSDLRSRCILLGFEKNRWVRILSKQINKKRYYTTVARGAITNPLNISPWFFTGFADAEGSFSILIQANSQHATGWRVKPLFTIGLNKRDMEILKDIQSFLGIGKIHVHGKESIQSVRRYSSLTSSQLNPWFVTGFADGESSFSLFVMKSSRVKTGWVISASFQIGLDASDKGLLEQIQSFFGVGKIQKGEKNIYRYMVTRPKELRVIIDHFYLYPLISKKRINFEFFKVAVDLISRKEHLTMEGVNKIATIKASMNLGLSTELKVAFPDSVPLPSPVLDVNSEIKDPNWLSGFTCAEGCFYITLKKTGSNNYVGLKFQITQHIKDEKLLKDIISYLGCGRYEINKVEAGNYLCKNFGDINEKILPFFSRYPLVGVKSANFADFCKAAEIMKTKAHLTEGGLNEIIKIKSGMNKKRVS